MKNLTDVIQFETSVAKAAIDQLDFKVADQAFQKIENALYEGIINILYIRIRNAKVCNDTELVEKLEMRVKTFEQLGE